MIVNETKDQMTQKLTTIGHWGLHCKYCFFYIKIKHDLMIFMVNNFLILIKKIRYGHWYYLL